MDNNTKTVIVLGGSRSGTSVTAGLLHILGVNMGDNLKGATASNAKGHFEDWDFVNLIRDIFKSAGGNNWQLPQEGAILAQREAFDDRIRECIKKKEKGLWGWKMPWLIFAIDLFLPHLTNPYFVVVFRNPISHAQSFTNHNKRLNFSQSQKLNALYNIEIADFLDKNTSPRIYVSYEDIVADPLKEAKRLSAFVGLPLRNQKKILDFVIR